MRNLTLSADWNDFVLFDDYEAAPVDGDRIPHDLRRRLSSWNVQYRLAGGFSRADRDVAGLDATGRALAAELKAVFPDAQLRYAGEAQSEARNLGSVV